MDAVLRRAALALGLLVAGLPVAQAQSGDVQRGRGLFESRCGG